METNIRSGLDQTCNIAQFTSAEPPGPEPTDNLATSGELSSVQAPVFPEFISGDFLATYQQTPGQKTTAWSIPFRQQGPAGLSEPPGPYESAVESFPKSTNIDWDNPQFSYDWSLPDSLLGVPNYYTQGGNPSTLGTGWSTKTIPPVMQYGPAPPMQSGGTLDERLVGAWKPAGTAVLPTKVCTAVPGAAATLPEPRPALVQRTPALHPPPSAPQPMSVVGNSTLIPTTPPPTTTATSAGETVAVIVPPRLPIDVITRPDRTRPRKRPARSPIKTPERIPFVRVHPGMTVQQRREAEAHNAAAAANRVERGKIKNNKAAKRSRARKDAQLDLQFREIAQLRWECQWWKDRAIARGEKEVRFDWSVHEKECDEELRRLDEEALRRLPLAKGGAKREEAAAPTTPDVDADGEDEE